MSRFIQSLESRTLFAVTSATLSADLALISSDDKAVKADLIALSKGAGADLKTITADLKGTAKTNALLLKTLKTDELKAFAKIKSDVSALLKATPLSKHAVAEGNGLLKKPGSKLGAKVAADAAALGTLTTTALASLQTDSMGTGVGTDLTALVSANPSNTALATDATTARTDLSTLGGTLVTAAQKYSTDVGTLKTDLLAIPTV